MRRGHCVALAPSGYALLQAPCCGKFYACDEGAGGESIFASFGEAAVRAFLAGVQDGSVESRPLLRPEGCEGGDCDPNSFSPCCAPGAPHQAGGRRPGPPSGLKAEDLRFEVGQRVECNTGGGGWAKGTIVALMYSATPTGAVAPYQIKLDDGMLIFAPIDDDRVIRAASSS